MTTYLGLDLGVASLGFCLISFTSPESSKIIHSGVRIFPDALDEKQGTPKNTARRDFRLARRQLNRRKLKRRHIREFLYKHGLLASAKPPPQEKGCRKGHGKGRIPEHVYALRKKALAEKLSCHELGEILQHLANHRGFIGSPKLAMDEHSDSASKRELTAEEKNQEKEELGKILEEQNLTLGAWLADQPTQRNRAISHEMICDEWQQIYEHQRKYHPDLLNNSFKDEYDNLLSYRRPIFWRLKTLVRSERNPSGKPALTADWKTQQVTMLQRLNNLQFGENSRPPDPAEWEELRQLMMHQKSVTFTAMRKALRHLWKQNGTPLDTKFNFETGADKKTSLQGNATEAMLVKLLGENTDSYPYIKTIREEIARRKWEIEYKEVARAYHPSNTPSKPNRVEIRDARSIKDKRKAFVDHCQNVWGMTEKQAEDLANAPLPSGWSRLTEEEITAILPFLEQPSTSDDLKKNDFSTIRDIVLKDQFPPPKTGENRDILPSHPKHLEHINNPVVIRCLNETRKVVNNLIRAYGKPDYIRVEMARDVKLAGKKKQEAQKTISKHEKTRKEAEKWLQDKNLPTSSDNILKYRLWKESNHRCIYSGKSISAEALFMNNQFQIEHIYPRSRSGDDSFNNKLLCETGYNARKGNQTPFEAFGYGPEWEAMLRRLDDKTLTDLPEAKKRRFKCRNYPKTMSDKWAKRLLNDTAYAAREVRDFLGKLYPEGEATQWGGGGEPRVQVVNGKLTSQLGHSWGMYRAFNKRFLAGDSGAAGGKIRDDHRHHALDAAVIAMTSINHVRRISEEYNDQRRQGFEDKDIRAAIGIPLPWAGFHQAVLDSLSRIIISYRVDSKISGALTDNTHLGPVKDEDGSQITGEYVKRVDLRQSPTAGQIRMIRDPRVKKIVWDHARRFDETGLMPADPDHPVAGKEKKKINAAITEAIKKAFKSGECLPRMPVKGDANTGNPIRKVRIIVKQEERLTVPVNRRTGAVALKGDNHHIALYQGEDGTLIPRDISKLEAMRRVQQGEPVIAPFYQGKPLLMHWCKRDMFEHTDPETGEVTYWRVVILRVNLSVVVLNTDTTGKIVKYPMHHRLLKDGFRKIAVDPIGRIRPAK